MSTITAQDIAALVRQGGTLGIVATSDESGAPVAAISPFLQADDRGRLIHPELLETSPTHRNLLHSLWFDRPVSVTLRTENGRSYLIKGRPVKSLISGPEFSRQYVRIREELGDADLAAVWFIHPVEIREETYAVRQKDEEERHPFFIHIDRLVVPSEEG